MKELILGLILGALLIIGVSAVFFDIRDQENCENKGGVWAAHRCFKKEYFLGFE